METINGSFCLGYFNSDNMVRDKNSSSGFYSHLSKYSKKDAPDTCTCMVILYQNLMDQYNTKTN